MRDPFLKRVDYFLYKPDHLSKLQNKKLVGRITNVGCTMKGGICPWRIGQAWGG